jgi:hypothetical protein
MYVHTYDAERLHRICSSWVDYKCVEYKSAIKEFWSKKKDLSGPQIVYDMKGEKFHTQVLIF